MNVMNYFRRLSDRGQKPSTDWAWPYDVQPLVQRLAALDINDPLYPLLLGFLDAQILSQSSVALSPEALAQWAGRVNMCSDLKGELCQLWRQSHAPPAAGAKVGAGKAH